MVFDTETTSIDKPFCYNSGYVIADLDTMAIIDKKDFIAEQVWHNNMLFTTAYYADKREQYVKSMKARKTIMDKFGYITQTMARDIKYYDISMAFAFNSPFDKRVFEYNCDWFKCINPFDNVEIKDIRAFAHHYICNTQAYKDFCDKHGYYTESGHYSTTAEIVYRYITNNTDFIEEHTALADSEIEWEILKTALNNGADITQNYSALSSLKREQKQLLTIVYNGNQNVYEYSERINYKDKSGKQVNKIILKN